MEVELEEIATYSIGIAIHRMCPKNESARTRLESSDARRTALPRSLLKNYFTFESVNREWHEGGTTIGRWWARGDSNTQPSD